MYYVDNCEFGSEEWGVVWGGCRGKTGAEFCLRGHLSLEMINVEAVEIVHDLFKLSH